jgi:hypothetical protein
MLWVLERTDMPPTAIQSSIPPWRTACSGLPPDLSGEDLQALRAHLSQCDRQRSAVYVWRSVGQELVSLMAARLLTTALVVAAVVLLLLKSL